MWRSLFAATLVYASGHPSLDGYRPGFLDRPLQAFYRDVNTAARSGKTVLMSFDGQRCMHYLRGYVATVDKQLRGSN